VRLRFGFFLIYASQGKFYIIYKGEMQILPIRTSPLGVIKYFLTGFTIDIIQITTAKINEIYLLKTREEIKTELKVEISRENKRKGEQFGTGLMS